MLAELEGNQLEVGLFPCKRFVNEGGCIRVAISKNAKWYRDFCSRHASSRIRNHRLFDTKIRRQSTISILKQLTETGKSRSKYANEILSIAAKIDQSSNPF